MAPITKLTRKQKKVLDFIRHYIKQNKKSPLVREIQQGMGFKSVRSVSQYLDVLDSRGYLKRGQSPRGIQLVDDFRDSENNETVLIPLRGSASCGLPDFFADDNVEAYYPVDKNLLGNRLENFFLIKPRGTSMNKAEIDDSKLVLVEKRDSYDDGEDIVAIVDGLATIKRFSRGKSAVMLSPVSSDSRHKPIILTEDFNIAGKVVSILPDPKDFNRIEYIPIEEDNY